MKKVEFMSSTGDGTVIEASYEGKDATFALVVGGNRHDVRGQIPLDELESDEYVASTSGVGQSVSNEGMTWEPHIVSGRTIKLFGNGHEATLSQEDKRKLADLIRATP
ncbi:MAG: hypothetical protein WD716_05935 [Fimbriimonadaceae bacterium]